MGLVIRLDIELKRSHATNDATPLGTYHSAEKCSNENREVGCCRLDPDVSAYCTLTYFDQESSKANDQKIDIPKLGG